MSLVPFDRETWLDLTVNLVPLGIMLFFVALFAVVQPWGYDPVESVLSLALVVVPFAILAIVTYYGGRAIFRAERTE